MMDVIVIGAGIAGLTAANRLRQTGGRVIVLEKARGVGGRMATRRESGDGRRWDHGAQFVTLRSPELCEEVRDLVANGTLREWGSEYREGRDARWIHPDGMSALAKHTSGKSASPGSIELSCKVTRVMSAGEGWTVQSEDGRDFQARALLVTAPVPQALDLLSGAETLTSEERSALGEVRYHACFALLASLPGPSGLAEPGWLENPHPDLSGIFDQNRKGLRSHGSAVVIHTTPEASARWLEDSEESTQAAIWSRARPFLQGEPSELKLHRWRYSQPAMTFPTPFFEAARAGSPIFLAGDGFGGARVEGAYLSGLAVADRMIERLHPRV